MLSCRQASLQFVQISCLLEDMARHDFSSRVYLAPLSQPVQHSQSTEQLQASYTLGDIVLFLLQASSKSKKTQGSLPPKLSSG